MLHYHTVSQIIDLFEETKSVLERQILSTYLASASSSIYTRLQPRIGNVVSARNIRRVLRKENDHRVYSKVQWKTDEAHETDNC